LAVKVFRAERVSLLSDRVAGLVIALRELVIALRG